MSDLEILKYFETLYGYPDGERLYKIYKKFYDGLDVDEFLDQYDDYEEEI